MSAPFTFQNQTGPIPLSELDDNFTAALRSTVYTATGGQTTFSILPYTTGGYLMVFINGALQTPGLDYTEASTTSIVFAKGLQANDVVVVRG